MTNKKHIEFIKLVSEGQEYATAYATVCNQDASSSNCKSQGSRLAKRYAKEIQEAREKTIKAIEAAHESKDVQNALNQVLTQAQVDAELCKIITGEAMVEKIVVVDKKIQVIKSAKPDHSDKLRAIDLYNKRFGSNGAVKVDLQGKMEGIAFVTKRREK